VVAGLALLVVALYLSQLDPTYFQTWKHDAGARVEFERKARLVSMGETESVRADSPPALEPDLLQAHAEGRVDGAVRPGRDPFARRV
jgi:hypothetical protein